MYEYNKLCGFACLSVHQSVYLSDCVRLCLCLCLSLSVFLSVYLSISALLSFCLFVSFSHPQGRSPPPSYHFFSLRRLAISCLAYGAHHKNQILPHLGMTKSSRLVRFSSTSDTLRSSNATKTGVSTFYSRSRTVFICFLCGNLNQTVL